jgi:site-specific DNA-methyltransferase (adenine-specific)
MIPPLRPEEREQLEANLIADGCRDPLVVWQQTGVLLDGHNRYEICRANNIPFGVAAVALADREAAADWIDAHQLGRRNLTPDQYALLRGRRYNRLKKAAGAPVGNRNAAGQLPQNEEVVSTAQKLAKQHGVSKATIERDGQFAEAVATVKATVDPEIESKIVRGAGPSKAAVVEAAKMLGSRKDREAALVWDKARNMAKDILTGKHGSIAKAKREVDRQRKRDEQAAQAKAARDRAKAEAKAAVEATKNGVPAPKPAPPPPPPPPPPAWQVIEGDCVAELGKLARGSARLVFADPPYNIGIPYGKHHNDSMPREKYLEWCFRWIRAAADVLADDGSLWVLISHEYAADFEMMIREADLTVRSWITWWESFGNNHSHGFNRCSRPLFHAVKDPNRFVFNREAVTRQSDRQKQGDKRADPDGKTWDDVWGIEPRIPRLVDNAKERLPDFPTQLPLALLRPIVGCASDPGDLVVDPFSGSGTTGEACLRSKRRYIGIDNGKEFVRRSRDRLTIVQGEVQ